jgi:hypothetical protein
VKRGKGKVKRIGKIVKKHKAEANFSLLTPHFSLLCCIFARKIKKDVEIYIVW